MGFESEILSIILFGSYARGDSRPDSDIDVCVLLERDSFPDESEVRRLAPSLANGQLSLVFYSKDAIADMIDYGSLFLWHIKLEGVTLYGHEYADGILGRLNPFVRHQDEISYYK